MDRPLLKLPEPVEFTPKDGPRGGPNIVKPSKRRQGERLSPRFERLLQVVNDPQALFEFRSDPTSIAPERAIVFEVAGILKDFYAQAHEIGLEYLGDYEEEIEPTDEFYIKGKRDKLVAGRIYLAMPDVRALRELLRLWGRYKSGKSMETGKSEWGKLFSMLVDVRPWGPEDRVPPETIQYWEECIMNAPGDPVRFEVELWFQENLDQRRMVFQELQREILELGGQVIQHADIPEIRYEAALIDIPPDHIRSIIEHRNVSLARSDEIMFLRPQSVARHHPRILDDDGETEWIHDDVSILHRTPVVGLLDGLPIQNHQRLDGRIVIDDPDDIGRNYEVNMREHGTSMASLIVHGDLNRNEPPIKRPLYVLPILQPNEHGVEHTSRDQLLIDIIYRAVHRMKEGEGDQPATAPQVALVNLSLGDKWRPFARVMSPLGRLIDYLSYNYNVLFLISAGNVMDRLNITDYDTGTAFEDATPEDREKAILKALDANKAHRTLFSPAEAINALTVGAANQGSAFNNDLPANLIDPFTDDDLPNIASALGLGYRKAMKPEILFEGGRTPVQIVKVDESVTIQPVRNPARMFGIKCALPDQRGGTRNEGHTWGTSVATALATRAGHLIFETVMDADGGSYHADVDVHYMPVIVKALLVHGASWGPKGAMLDEFFGPKGRGQHVQRRDNISRFLGYGVPNVTRVLDCTENRATLLGYGRISANTALVYQIPLPADLNGVGVLRSLTITLAWFSPINPRHQGYRMAALDVSEVSNDRFWIVSDREPFQPTDKSITRGTVFHERRSGEKAAVFVDDGYLLLRISCRSTAGELQDSVPYALAISFEVDIGSGIQVYEQIRDRLITPVRPTVGIST